MPTCYVCDREVPVLGTKSRCPDCLRKSLDFNLQQITEAQNLIYAAEDEVLFLQNELRLLSAEAA